MTAIREENIMTPRASLAPASPCVARPIPKRSASRLLYLGLACANALVVTQAGAEPLPCRLDHALYRPVTGESYEIEFFRNHSPADPIDGPPYINRAGVLRYRGKPAVLEYEFAIMWDMRFAWPSLVIIKNSSVERDPDQDDNERPKEIGPGFRMIQFGDEFGSSKKNQAWPRYFVLPDMSVHFGDWLKGRPRRPDVLPSQVWEMVPCSGEMPSRPKAEKPPPAPPSNLWWRLER
jgi:hypothetical protein